MGDTLEKQRVNIYKFPDGWPGAGTGTSPAVLAYRHRDLRSPENLPEAHYLARRGPSGDSVATRIISSAGSGNTRVDSGAIRDVSGI